MKDSWEIGILKNQKLSNLKWYKLETFRGQTVAWKDYASIELEEHRNCT